MSREPLRAEVRPAVRDPNRIRKRKGDVDKFFVDLSKKPDGVDWNFKRASVFGQEDKNHMRALAENGWLPQDASVFGQGETGPVEVDGMILMERPDYLSQEARDEDYQNAVGQLGTKISEIKKLAAEANPAGHARLSPRLKREIGAMEVAE